MNLVSLHLKMVRHCDSQFVIHYLEDWSKGEGVKNLLGVGDEEIIRSIGLDSF